VGPFLVSPPGSVLDPWPVSCGDRSRDPRSTLTPGLLSTGPSERLRVEFHPTPDGVVDKITNQRPGSAARQQAQGDRSRAVVA